MNSRFLFYFFIDFVRKIEIRRRDWQDLVRFRFGENCVHFSIIRYFVVSASSHRQTVNPIEWGTLISLWKCRWHRMLAEHRVFPSKITKWIVSLLWRIESTESARGPLKTNEKLCAIREIVCSCFAQIQIGNMCKSARKTDRMHRNN